PTSTIEVLAGDERLLGAVVGPRAALEAGQIAAVDVDLERVARGRVVHRVDLVTRHQARDFAAAVALHAERLELRPLAAGLGDAVARLLDLVVHHADHAPRLVVMRAGLVARPPDDGGHVALMRAVQHGAHTLSVGRAE